MRRGRSNVIFLCLEISRRGGFEDKARTASTPGSGAGTKGDVKGFLRRVSGTGSSERPVPRVPSCELWWEGHLPGRRPVYRVTDGADQLLAGCTVLSKPLPWAHSPSAPGGTHLLTPPVHACPHPQGLPPAWAEHPGCPPSYPSSQAWPRTCSLSLPVWRGPGAGAPREKPASCPRGARPGEAAATPPAGPVPGGGSRVPRTEDPQRFVQHTKGVCLSVCLPRRGQPRARGPSTHPPPPAAWPRALCVIHEPGLGKADSNLAPSLGNRTVEPQRLDRCHLRTEIKTPGERRGD